MFSISCPEFCPAGYGGGRNQCVAQFNRVTFSVSSQVFAGKPANACIGGNAVQRLEKSFQRPIFRGAGSCPEFGDADRRDQEQTVGPAEFEPSRRDRLIPATGDLNQYVGIDEDGQWPPNRSSLEPLRSCRTSSPLSTVCGRDFRMPTKFCIAAIRVSGLPM